MLLDLPQGYWLDTVDSTMAEARRLIAAGSIHGTAFVVADHQTEGRGTHGRHWASPAHAGIYLSVIHVPPEAAVFETTQPYTLAAGVACVEALRHVTGLCVQLKPINDLVVADRKLGGILVESDLNTQGLTSLVTGIGLNVAAVPRDLDRPMISPVSLEEILSCETYRAFSREALIETLVAKVCFWYALLWNGQHGQVTRAWERYQLSS